MDEEQPKIPVVRPLASHEKGEALPLAGGGIESPLATQPSESPASTDQLIEEITEAANIEQALERVIGNKGAPGIDGITVESLRAYFISQWPSIRLQLFEGTYRPSPVRRVEIPKDGGGVRSLGIPTGTDRVIQQMVLQVLQKRWDGTFSESSFGFRPGRSAHQAIAKAQEIIRAGHTWVVDLDLEKFFDRVNHDVLMSRIAKRVEDKRLLKLIRAFLNAGIMEGGLVSPSVEGTPQGGPLSPLLSNVLLDELDKKLERDGHRFVRYADDCNIYVRSERAGHRVKDVVTRFLSKDLRLKVNEEKSAVAKPWQRKFLGFSFGADSEAKRRIAPKSIERFKERVRELTGKGRSLKGLIAQLVVYLRGWQGYFGFCQTPSTLRNLNAWTRRRLRMIVWRHWKYGRRRFAELRKRGIGKELAAKTAGSPHGPWHLSKSPALSFALPNRLFANLGLVTLKVRDA